MMTVGQLAAVLATLPPDMPVLTSDDSGCSDDVLLYLIPAYINPTPYGAACYEGHDRGRLNDYDEPTIDTTALAVSRYGHDADAVDITPVAPPTLSQDLDDHHALRR